MIMVTPMIIPILITIQLAGDQMEVLTSKPQVNYTNEQIRNGGIPEFKQLIQEESSMQNNITTNLMPDDLHRFQSIDDFLDRMERGGEMEFSYGDLTFDTCIFDNQYHIYEIDHVEESDQGFDTPEEMLEYLIDDIPLRQIITKVYLWSSIA